MEKPLTSTPILRRALRKRIGDFGCGRVEVHTAVLEAVTNDAEDAARLRADLTEAVRAARNCAQAIREGWPEPASYLAHIISKHPPA